MSSRRFMAALAAVALAWPVAGCGNGHDDRRQVQGSPANKPTPTSTPRQPGRHSITLRDGPGDVWKLVHPEAATGPRWLRMRAVPTADLLALRAVHGRTDLTIVMSFADLTRASRKLFWVEIVTPRLTRLAHVDVGPRHPRGRHHLMTITSAPVGRPRGMTHRISYARETLTIVIPLDLLGTPRWVRVGAENELQLPPNGGRGLLVRDNSFNHGYSTSGWRTMLTPRLYAR